MTDYSTKIAEEINRYKDVPNIHELPAIHHYWSIKYLLPIIQTYGFHSIQQVFIHYLSEACAGKPNKTLRFISIGAGNCETEVALALALRELNHHNFIFECLDINPDMLARGEQLAVENGVRENMEFKATDLNYWSVEYTYDVIIALQCLHHFVELEMIFDKIYEYLSPDGYFVTHDMIGRNGHLRWHEALNLLNAFWQILPDKYKYNHQLQRHEPEFMDWDCSHVGFEGIRAQDILPLLIQRFKFELFIPWGGVIDVFTDRSFGHNFDPEAAWDREFIDKVHQVNFEQLAAGNIKPTQMIAAMRKSRPSRKMFFYGLSPRSCVREPNAPAPVVPVIFANLTATSEPAPTATLATPTILPPHQKPPQTTGYQSFIFVHVPKCAGTSFREYLYKTGLANDIPKSQMHVPGYGGLPNEKNIPQLTEAELAQFRADHKKILAAHCTYNVHQDLRLNMEKPFYYILLRDPVERFISHHNYFNRHLGIKNRKGIHINDLDPADFQLMLVRMSNIQLCHLINAVNFIKSRLPWYKKVKSYGKQAVRTLSGGRLFVQRPAGIHANETWLEEAERLLEEEYGAFGILENMDLSLQYLSARSPEWLQFSGQHFPSKNERVFAVNDEPVKDEIIEAIRNHNQFDIRLHELAQRLLLKKTENSNPMNVIELAQKILHIKPAEPAQELREYYPAGHYYSAVFSVEELKMRENQIWKGTDMKTLPGIDLNAEGQVKLMDDLAAYYHELPFDKGLPNMRYTFENDYYSYTDAIFLYGMMRHFKPKRIIEVGSGYSSAVMLDVKEHFGLKDLELAFIEPFPERLHSLMRKADYADCQVIAKPVQDVDASFFGSLQKGDILFIDSSHVVKTGSDLHYLMFEVLPALQPGVLIHFHDIFYPFEYPQEWVYAGRNWNENYFLRAFLMHNQAYKIRLFANYLVAHHVHVFEKMPLCYNNGGGNMWIEKLA